MRDDSSVCNEWSDRKLYETVDAQLVMAVAAETPALRLGHLSGARALLGILADRARPKQVTCP